MISRRKNLPLTAFVGLLSVVGCQAPVDLVDSVGQRRSAIVNGTHHEGHHAVGALVSGGGSSACTGTLIGSRTVLTAAHCVYKRWPVDFYLVDLSGPRYTASSVSIHPSYAGGNMADLAIVRLTRAVGGVQPMRLAEQPPRVNEEVLLVGYGKTTEDGSDYGEKRIATSKVSAVFPQLFTISGGDGNVCDGDSGGPTIVERDGKEVVLGVHSTKGVACGAEGNDMRVDAFVDWILHESETGEIDTGDETPPSVSVLSPADNARVGAELTVVVGASDDSAVAKVVLRIDGEVAAVSRQAPHEFRLENLEVGEHTLEAAAHDLIGNVTSTAVRVTVGSNSDRAFGLPCSTGDQCQSRICTADGSLSFCSRSCSATAPCGGGFVCVDGLCQLSPNLARYGESCDTEMGCAGDGLCARDQSSGQQFCTRSCDPQQPSSCPSGSSCTLTGNSDVSVCVPDASLDRADGPPAQGCSIDRAGHGSDTTLPVLSLLLLLVVVVRRTRG